MSSWEVGSFTPGALQDFWIANTNRPSLVPDGDGLATTFSHQPDWSRLRTLVLQFSEEHQSLICAVKLLEKFYDSTLTEVIMELTPVLSIQNIFEDLSLGSVEFKLAAYKELERALLRFPQPGMVWTVKEPLRLSREIFWTQELGKHFPLLFQRPAASLTVKSKGLGKCCRDAFLGSEYLNTQTDHVLSRSSWPRFPCASSRCFTG